MRFVHLSVCIAAAVLVASAARADPCADLAREKAALHAAADNLTNDPSKGQKDLDEILSQIEATENKSHGRCPPGWEHSLDRPWRTGIDLKFDAIRICTVLSGGNVEYQEDDYASEDDRMGGCIIDLVPFGDTLNPRLKRCLATCRDALAKLYKPEPECAQRMNEKAAVLKDMDGFVERAKSGQSKDVVIDFKVLEDRYHRSGNCKWPYVLPEIKAHFDLLNSEIMAIGAHEHAKIEYAKYMAKGDHDAAHAVAEACIDEMARVFVRDAKLERLFAECRDLWTRSAAAPQPSPRTTVTPNGRPRSKGAGR